MRIEKVTQVVIAFLIVAITMVGGIGIAQDRTGGKANQGVSGKAPKVDVIGTIKFSQAMGGYYVLGKEPGGELFVVNQNIDVLKPLFESGKTVAIKGHFTKAAEYLYIEKIDGKKYAGTAKNRPPSK
jgi:hypothetical protein